jgi:putative two-component system response regulator
MTPKSVTSSTILVVDDEEEVRELLAEHLTSQGYQVETAVSGADALERLERAAIDLVITDVHMRGMTGVELTARVKRDPRFQLLPVVILTAVSDLSARVAGLAAGADDFFAKPFDFLELRTRLAVLLRVKGLVNQLERAEVVITTLGRTIEARDPYTADHCERLSRYAVALGRALEVDDDCLRALRLGGFLHDVGKIAVPDRVLLKPGPLDAAERASIMTHPCAGADLVAGMRTLDPVRSVIRHHHERWDGSGYPDGLRGEAIPREARIMAIVDVYDALRTARPYKRPLGKTEALETLFRETDRGFWDPTMVPVFSDVLERMLREDAAA